MNSSNKLPINEFFPTIQGEATYTGTPSFFLRLQQCPIACSFCDTKYTWDLTKEDETTNINEIINKKSLDFTKGEGNSIYIYLSSQEIFKLIKNSNLKHVVFTGGEPCIYDLTDITTLLHENGYQTQIETSGTFEIKAHPSTWVTLSPKYGKSIKSNYEVLKTSYERANEIKYPVGKLLDIENLKYLINKNKLFKKIIWLQPLSTNIKATELCTEMAMKHNWRLSLQTHKFIHLR